MKFWFGKKEELTGREADTAPNAGLSAVAPAAKASADVPPPVSVPPPPAATLIRPQADQKVLYYELMNGLYDAVLILDEKGHVVDANERVSPVLGYGRDEMWDMPVETVVKGIGPQVFRQMKDALHNKQQVLINAKCTRKDGTSFPGEVGVSTLHLTRSENLVFTIRNIEKRIAEIREQLRTGAAAAQPAPAHRRVLKAVVKPTA